MTFFIYQAFRILFRILEFFIFARVLLSWIPIFRSDSPVIRFIYLMTEPVLGPLREILRKSPLGSSGMMLDFSPVLALVLFQFIMYFLGVILL